MRHWPVTFFLQGHRTLARVIPRRIRDRLVWREIERDGAFSASIAQGMADADAGRLYRHGLWNLPSIPCSSWQADDRSQPDGWHHDGHRWRLNRDGGWSKDHSGYWRYTKPGEIGWLENPDGSWRYDASPVR